LKLPPPPCAVLQVLMTLGSCVFDLSFTARVSSFYFSFHSDVGPRGGLRELE
jgi:hypothetical protein